MGLSPAVLFLRVPARVPPSFPSPRWGEGQGEGLALGPTKKTGPHLSGATLFLLEVRNSYWYERHRDAVRSGRQKVARSGLLLPRERGCGSVLGYSRLEKVLLFGQVDRLAHPREGILGPVLSRQADSLESTVGDVLHVVAE